MLCPQAVMSVGRLAREVREDGRDAVARICMDAPALVLRPRAAAPDGEMGATAQWSVGALDLSETHSGEGASPWAVISQPDGLVVPLLKSDRNPFAGVIAVGRGKTTDVQLMTGGVSKSHALFRRGQGGWLIQDSGSRNGTFLNGLRLEPTRDHAIASGHEVRFSDVQGMFLDAEGLVTLCSMVAPS